MTVWHREDPIRSFAFKKRIFVSEQSKNRRGKMIFYGLFLVLETIERRK